MCINAIWGSLIFSKTNLLISSKIYCGIYVCAYIRVALVGEEMVMIHEISEWANTNYKHKVCMHQTSQLTYIYVSCLSIME